MTRTYKRYSEAFRREVVAEYEKGTSILSLQKKYGIMGSATIPGWIDKYGREGLRPQVVTIQKAEDANRVHELEKRVKELEQALGQVSLEKLKLESIVTEMSAGREEQVKKNGRSSSKPSAPKAEQA